MRSRWCVLLLSLCHCSLPLAPLRCACPPLRQNVWMVAAREPRDSRGCPVRAPLRNKQKSPSLYTLVLVLVVVLLLLLLFCLKSPPTCLPTAALLAAP